MGRMRTPGEIHTSLPAVPRCPPWTKIEQDAWLRVLQSDIGKKFLARAGAVHYGMLNAAGEDHFHAAQSIHAARGFGECIKWLQSLSSVADAQATTDTASTGESKSGEKSEIEQILARISP
jgi:hypothetical protein